MRKHVIKPKIHSQFKSIHVFIGTLKVGLHFIFSGMSEQNEEIGLKGAFDPLDISNRDSLAGGSLH